MSDGIARTFPAGFDAVVIAVDEAVETLPVNIAAPVTFGKRRVVHFSRPITSGGYGDRGRVVITPIDQDTTRVTVAVSSWDPLALTERAYAGHVFRDVEARVMPAPRLADSRSRAGNLR